MTPARRIRVLLTVPHLTSTAAPYRHMMAIARYLPKEAFDLKICTLRKNGYEETKPLLDALDIPVFHARYRDKFRSLNGIRQWMQGIKTIEQYGPYDVQHSMDYSSIPLEPMMAKWAHRPYIYSHRNMVEGKHYILQGIKFRLAKCIICISDAVEKLLQKLKVPQGKIRKIYNGIDVEAIEQQRQPGLTPRSGYVLFVGHITPRKRQEDAIRAIAQLRYELPHIRLGIAGNEYEPDYMMRLRQLAQELEVTERVDFLGTRTDVPQLMQQAEALILCSTSDALPLTLLEAMTIGVPIVASAVDGSKELIEDGVNGLLVQPYDVNGYVQALHTVLTQRPLVQKFVDNARQKIDRHYSAPRMVDQIAQVYQEVIRDRG